MNTEYKNNDARKQESEINISDIFHLVLANWYWFVLSVLVCGGVAFFYLKSSSKVYSRMASVLIRDDSKGGAMSESAAFADLSLFGAVQSIKPQKPSPFFISSFSSNCSFAISI